MSFTCLGTITKWRVAGELVQARNRDPPPQLQIWRQQQDENGYFNAHSISLLECEEGMVPGMVPGNQNVYECDLSPGVAVEPGDILGIFLTRMHPQEMDSRFSVYFDNNAVTPPRLTTHEVRFPQTSFPFGGSTTQTLPLVALQVMPVYGKNI